jgi:uncharacterized protein HI_1042
MARVSYPVSNYFTLDRIDEDQAQDYAKRKGWDERDDEIVGFGDEVRVINYEKRRRELYPLLLL